MNLRPKLVLLSCILFVNIVPAQKISHSIGIGATFSGSYVVQRIVTASYIDEYTARLNRIGFQYFPRMILTKNVRSSVSVGVPLTVGVSWATKNEFTSISMMSSTVPIWGLLPEKNNKAHFAVEIPVVVDFNIGAGSSLQNRKGIGAYLGGGYAYSYTTFTNNGTRTVTGFTFS
jgi:hypothetical protein